MLLVVAQAAVVTQSQPQCRPLAHQYAVDNAAIEHQQPPGHLIEAEHKQSRNENEHIQDGRQKQRLRLPVEANRPIRRIQARNGIGCQKQDHGDGSQPEITAQRKRRCAVKQAESNPVSGENGQKNQRPVGEHIELVQKSLIFFYHGVFPPVSTKIQLYST